MGIGDQLDGMVPCHTSPALSHPVLEVNALDFIFNLRIELQNVLCTYESLLSPRIV